MFRTELIGNLGQDVSVTKVQSGDTVGNFSVAVDDSYFDKNKNERVPRVIWVNCAIWIREGKSTKRLDYLKKGTKVFVSGKASAKAYQSQESETKSSLEVTVNTLQFLSKVTDGNQEVQEQELSEVNQNDDMPF